MAQVRKLTPDEEAEMDAFFEELIGGKHLRKPKAVVVEDKVIRDADVYVSKADKNAGREQLVQVRRPEYVTINIAAYEAQLEEKREARRRRRELDQCRMGLYGPTDEDDD